MDEITTQLKRLINVTRRINNHLSHGEADITFLEEQFEQRQQHVEHFVRLTSKIDSSSLSKHQKESFDSLISRFEKQSQHLQEALDYIAQESKNRLDEAIKSNNAEKSYQLLKR